jgi:hypothetical protein
MQVEHKIQTSKNGRGCSQTWRFALERTTATNGPKRLKVTDMAEWTFVDRPDTMCVTTTHVTGLLFPILYVSLLRPVPFDCR